MTVDEAYVSIGEGTVVMAGHKGSIFNYGDDVPLNWLGLFNSEAVNTGVLADNWSNTGTSNSIQITHDLGNGFSISGGLEQLENNGIAVGVLAYKSETVSAHISTSVADILEGSDQGYWYTHAGIAATLDGVKLVAAASTDANSNWNVLGSAELSLDMFKIAGSVEADNDDYVGAGGSLTATLSEGVTLNLGGRFGTYQGDTSYELAAGAESKIAETLTLSGQVGYVFDGGYDHEDDPEGPTSSLVYGWVKLAWAPGGGFTSSIKGTVTNFLTDEYEYVKGPGFKVETEFKKTFE